MASNEIFERTYIVRVFHNKVLQHQYLPVTYPAIFGDPKKRMIMHLMKSLYESGIEITLDTMSLLYKSSSDKIKTFITKHRVPAMNDDDFATLLFDTSGDTTSDALFEFAVQQTKEEAFLRDLHEYEKELVYWAGYREFRSIVAKSKWLIKRHDLLFNPTTGTTRDQLQETMDYVNSMNEYVGTSSRALNTYLGGWTNGYPASIIAKSSHNKSTWITYNLVHTILSGKVERADVFSTEETAEVFWRRVFAIICKKSTSGMRQKDSKIEKSDIELVKKHLGSKLYVWDSYHKYNQLLDAMESVRTQMMVVDHLQAIQYPGTSSFLNNMIGNIPGFLDFQAKVAKRKHIPIINLSQVNDKDIAKTDRPSKAPRYFDAYGSSVLYQKSREFLALYYPYKDYEDNPFAYGDERPSINDFQISIEKSSFSRTGKINLYYDPDFATFSDSAKTTRKLDKLDYEAPKEKPIEELSLFDKKRK